jgi:rSAM/selenodomain-associated transferase 2
VYAPTHPTLADIARGEMHPVWRQINHPELSAAYPPLALLIFRLLAGLLPTPLFFKIVMVAFDIGVMIALVLIVRHRSVKPAGLILYALNPLVLLYIAGEGHLDVIQLFFLSLSLYLIICRKHHMVGFLILGLAVVSKYFALVAWPFLANAQNRWKSMLVLVPLVLYIPFLDAGPGLFQSLGIFVSNFHYNDSATMLIRLLFGEGHLIATATFLISGLICIYLFGQNKLRSVYLALGCLLIFLPTLHPWYLVLVAALLVFFPSRAWLYLQVAVVFTFPVIAVESETGMFQEIFWLKLFEYVPFYILLIWGVFREGYLFRDGTYPQPQSISVIIPTLNEEEILGRCIDSLRNRTGLAEIIVADSGSVDKTRHVAINRGCRVVESRVGRGIQIKEGIKAASGDVLIVLHADCVLAKGVFKRLTKALAADPHIVGGACGMQFETKILRTRFIASLNNLRAVLTGIAFGDQAQFFRKEALEHIGGFPAIMLMEDVELSLRLKEVGRLAFIRDGVVVSDRRWQGRHFAVKLLTVFYLFSRYLIERRWGRADQLLINYYNKYYT